MSIDFNKLSAEQKKELFKQMEDEKRLEEQKKQKQKLEYKNLVNDVVIKNYKKLEDVSAYLSSIKKNIFSDFETILEMKAELYGVKENQQSHTFTTLDGKSITLGNRVIDNFDDTIHTGIEKVKLYIKRVTQGEKQELEQLINLLLKQDKNGNLKASRVLELERIANEIDDIDLKDGVKIIKESYKPAKSSTYIEASYKSKIGKKIYLPLSIVNVDMEE